MAETIILSSPLYEAVLEALTASHKEAFKIEILLNSHPLPEGEFVIVEAESHCIGVPKHVLKEAGLQAWRIFFHENATCEDRFNASSVLLLLHPEYISAVNYRKRFILNAKEGIERDHSITRDLCFLESLFWSPLYRHTKSPTLWSHHEWLIKQADISSKGLLIDQIQLDKYLHAAEIHPKNVYAWQHLRYWILRHPEFWTVFPFAEGGDNLGNIHGRKRIEGPGMVDYFAAWALKHPSDTSSWSFLLWLLMDAPREVRGEVAKSQVSVFEAVLERAKAFEMRNEALWTFARTLAGSEAIPASLRTVFDQGAREVFAGGRNIETWLSHSPVGLALQSPSDCD